MAPSPIVATLLDEIPVHIKLNNIASLRLGPKCYVLILHVTKKGISKLEKYWVIFTVKFSWLSSIKPIFNAYSHIWVILKANRRLHSDYQRLNSLDSETCFLNAHYWTLRTQNLSQYAFLWSWHIDGHNPRKGMLHRLTSRFEYGGRVEYDTISSI